MKVLSSVSGGRTSMMMAINLHQSNSSGREVVNVFANTGQEHPNTLDFINRCDQEFGLNIVWVEAEVKESGTGTTSKVVNYDTACRDARLFEDMCKKYGLPNPDYPHCTRELKLAPIHHYVKSIWGKKPYQTAIGIRADEYRRVSEKAAEKDIFYPMVDAMLTKDDVFAWWRGQPFDLRLFEHQGNCLWCWKNQTKSTSC